MSLILFFPIWLLDSFLLAYVMSTRSLSCSVTSKALLLTHESKDQVKQLELCNMFKASGAFACNIEIIEKSYTYQFMTCVNIMCQNHL